VRNFWQALIKSNGLKCLFLGWLLYACCRPNSENYENFYAHLDSAWTPCNAFKETPYFLVVLVNARHLDYTDNLSFFRTLSKHPSDGSKNCDVGHAWIYLRGMLDGVSVELEGGHSGERGLTQARYFEGIMNFIEYGYANPTAAQKRMPRYEANPIRYLWQVQKDGFFQAGSGGHSPTCAAKIDLTEEQFLAILAFVETYPYQDYAITRNQCASFVSQIAALADWQLPGEVTMQLEPRLKIGGEIIQLWEDPCYSGITLSTPDIIEKSLLVSIHEGRAQEANRWYSSTHQEPAVSLLEKIRLAPQRIQRILLFR